MSQTLRKGRKIGDYKVEKFLKVSGLDNVESYMLVNDMGEKAIMKLVVDGCGCLEFDDEVCSAMNECGTLLRYLTVRSWSRAPSLSRCSGSLRDEYEGLEQANRLAKCVKIKTKDYDDIGTEK